MCDGSVGTVTNDGDWCVAGPFERDYSIIYGDADNTEDTSCIDPSAINALASEPADTPDDSRFDINTIGGVSFADLRAASSFIGSDAADKPTEHLCSP